MNDGIRPISKNEILDLFKKEDSMCKIKLVNDHLKTITATGFFLELNIKDIPVNKCLLTCNHIFMKDFCVDKIIEVEYKNKIKIIKFTENRKVFTNRYLDYTCIEILSEDKIKQFFQIDIDLLNHLFQIKGKELFLLQFLYGKELCYSNGIILKIEENKIIHNCPSDLGSAGSPLICRYNINYIIGIHYGSITGLSSKLKVATPITSIIDDILKKRTIITSYNYTKKYKDLEIIGNGNFGTIYKGKRKDDNYNIAIKVINKEEMRKRLRNDYNKENIEK